MGAGASTQQYELHGVTVPAADAHHPSRLAACNATEGAILPCLAGGGQLGKYTKVDGALRLEKYDVRDQVPRECPFKVGQAVKIRAKVEKPTNGWGSLMHESVPVSYLEVGSKKVEEIGIVQSVISEHEVLVDFPTANRFRARVSELVRVGKEVRSPPPPPPAMEKQLSEALSSALGRTRDEARAALASCDGDVAAAGRSLALDDDAAPDDDAGAPPTSAAAGAQRLASAPPAAARRFNSASEFRRLEKQYKKGIDPLTFRAVPNLASEGHHYHRLFKKENGAVHKLRHKRLMNEFKTFLRDGLPADLASSIAVRVDEDHPQMAKAMIAGVHGTPYDSGLFEFDIYVPPDYPNCPPKVNLMTTGKGQVRFNPNLYNCGKVCLSVLGTWSGPGWDSKQSSLWQVLLSIQSAILGAVLPFYNEPGFESQYKTARGKKNERVAENGGYERLRVATLRHAILEQLRAPPAAFSDFVWMHFAHKTDYIPRRIRAWIAGALALKKEAQTKGHVEALEKLLSEITSELDVRFKALRSPRRARAERGAGVGLLAMDESSASADLGRLEPGVAGEDGAPTEGGEPEKRPPRCRASRDSVGVGMGNPVYVTTDKPSSPAQPCVGTVSSPDLGMGKAAYVTSTYEIASRERASVAPHSPWLPPHRHRVTVGLLVKGQSAAKKTEVVRAGTP